MDIDGQDPSAIWYYLLLNSEFGLIHRLVQAHIVSDSRGKIVSEVTINDGLGRVDLLELSTNKIWEVKHGMGNHALAQWQVSTYIGGKITSKKATGKVNGYGAAGAFQDFFFLNCLGTTYFVYYYTPTPGVVIYEVKPFRKKLPDETVEHVYSPRKINGDKPSLAYAFSDYLEGALVLGLAFSASFMIGKVCSISGGGGDRLMKLLD